MSDLLRPDSEKNQLDISMFYFFPSKSISGEFVRRKDILSFFHAVKLAVNSLKDREYSNFDAHTTTNCCHGISILARDWICASKNVDFRKISINIERYITKLALIDDEWINLSLTEKIPNSILGLSVLYILKKCSYRDENYITRTSKERFNYIYPMSLSFRKNLISHLQIKISNLVAQRYQFLLANTSNSFNISDVSCHYWTKYVSNDYLRTDKRGRRYAAAAYSCQLVLGYLMVNKGYLAIKNDLISRGEDCIKSYVRLYKGLGDNKFGLVLDPLKEELDQPVVVFGGTCYSDTLTFEQLSRKMDNWSASLEKLILACDCHYPQFPLVSDDPMFESSPIVPEEKSIKDAFAIASLVKGVSITDPSLYCLGHIFPASMKQIIESMRGVSDLPISHIDSYYLRFKEQKAICA